MTFDDAVQGMVLTKLINALIADMPASQNLYGTGDGGSMSSPLAVSGNILTFTCTQAARLWLWLRNLVFILFTISLAVISVQASIAGKFHFQNFINICCGAFLVSATPLFIAFLADGARLDCPT